MSINETNMIERLNNVHQQSRGSYFVKGKGRKRYHEKSVTYSFQQGNFCGRGRGHSPIYERNEFSPKMIILNRPVQK